VELGHKLTLVFIAFCTAMATVMYFAFRERKLSKTMVEGDREAERRQDGRILLVVFGAAITGLLLTLLVAWIVFL
jgi:hypothetical protein